MLVYTYLSVHLLIRLQTMAVMRCSDVPAVLVVLVVFVWHSANVAYANTAEQLLRNMLSENYRPLRDYDENWSSNRLDERALFRRCMAELNANIDTMDETRTQLWQEVEKRPPIRRDAWNLFPFGAVLRKREHVQKRFRSHLNNRFDVNKYLVTVGHQPAFHRAFAKRNFRSDIG